jgi:hypothetical protein
MLSVKGGLGDVLRYGATNKRLTAVLARRYGELKTGRRGGAAGSDVKGLVSTLELIPAGRVSTSDWTGQGQSPPTLAKAPCTGLLFYLFPQLLQGRSRHAAMTESFN